MPQLEKLPAQENEMQQQKLHQEQNLQQDVNVEHHQVAQNDVEALRDAQVAQNEDAPHQNEDAPHQNDDAQPLKEENVDKLLNPFFSIFLF